MARIAERPARLPSISPRSMMVPVDTGQEAQIIFTMRWIMGLVVLLSSVAVDAQQVLIVDFVGRGAEAGTAGAFVLNDVGRQAVEQITPPAADVEPGVAQLRSSPSSDFHPCEQSLMPVVTAPIGREALVRRQQYWPLVAAAECRHGLPPGLLDALVLQESRYHPGALSPAGALGLAQLMPDTARSLGVSDRLDPLANLDGGARFLRAMLDKFGSVSLALAAYNAGPGRVQAVRDIPANSETPGYVRNVISFWLSRVHDDQQALRASAKLLGFATTAASSQTAR